MKMYNERSQISPPGLNCSLTSEQKINSISHMSKNNNNKNLRLSFLLSAHKMNKQKT